MPDHRRGYTKRGEGYQPTDEGMAQNYEDRAKNEATVFTPDIQKELVEELTKSCKLITCRMHAGTTQESHIHGLVSWKYERGWLSVRNSLKTSLTKRLKKIAPRLALSRGASRKHVKTRRHFDHLMRTYLPDHSGVGWFEDRGWVNLPKGAR
jgi:REP element-mobilizing transposase RayT